MSAVHFRVGNAIQVVSGGYVGTQRRRVLVPTRVFEVVIRSGGTVHGDRSLTERSVGVFSQTKWDTCADRASRVWYVLAPEQVEFAIPRRKASGDKCPKPPDRNGARGFHCRPDKQGKRILWPDDP